MEIKSDQNWHNNIISVRCLIVHQLWNIQNYLRPQPNFQVFFSTSTLSPSLSPKTLNALPIHKTKLWDFDNWSVCHLHEICKITTKHRNIFDTYFHVPVYLCYRCQSQENASNKQNFLWHFFLPLFVFVVLYIFLFEFVSVVWLGLASCCYCCLCILSGNHRTKNWLVKRVNGLIFSLSLALCVRAACVYPFD